MAAAGEKEGYFFFTADQPAVSRATCPAILQEHGRHPDSIIRPVYGTHPGMPVLMPGALRQELLALRYEQGGKSLMTDDNTIDLVIPRPEERLDIDTAEDYEKLIRE